MRRGEIWWASLPPPSGRRPVVLVSRSSAYEVRTSVTVVEISRTIRGIPSEVQLGARDGMPRHCAANADNIMTIPKRLLDVRVAMLRPDRIEALDSALQFSLSLPAPAAG